MPHSVDYFNARVQTEIERWPVGILIEFGPDLRMPHSRSMGEGLFELRPRGREGIGRALYCYVIGERVVILHGFVKKTQATPERELKIARKRMKEVPGG